MCVVLRACVAAILSLAVGHPGPAQAADRSLDGVAAGGVLCGRMPVGQVEEMDFHLYFPSEKQAIDAAADIDEAAFAVVVRTSAASPDWLLRAVYRELPTAAAHAIHSGRMSALARANGGQYHGSGCSSHTYRG